MGAIRDFDMVIQYSTYTKYYNLVEEKASLRTKKLASRLGTCVLFVT
jgi:hypothetical protein